MEEGTVQIKAGSGRTIRGGDHRRKASGSGKAKEQGAQGIESFLRDNEAGSSADERKRSFQHFKRRQLPF